MILDYDSRQRLIGRVLQRLGSGANESDEAVRRLILMTVAEEFAGSRLTVQDRQTIAFQLFNAMRGLDVLQPLMDDPDITEIMVNAPSSIYFEKFGQIAQADIHFHDRQHLTGVITNFFGRANRMLHEKKPLADMRLTGGARAHAALPPVAPDGPVLTIRKFTGLRPEMAALIENGFISMQAADDLAAAVRNRKTLFICGGTGTGKTTFLNILSEYIPASERVVTIEDAAELSLQGIPNLVRLESRQPGPDGDGGIALSDLIRSSLRMRPDRIIVGEVRGQEAFDMLQAMNTGHPGSLCTGHGNSCQDMLERLALMVLMAVQLPWSAVRGLISSALDIVIHLQRTPTGQRQVHEIYEVLSGGTEKFLLNPWYVRTKGGDLENVKNTSLDQVCPPL